MNSRNLTLKTVLFLLTGTFTVLAGCSGSNPVAPTAPETVSDVAVISAANRSVPDSLEAVGTVRAAQTAQIASQSTGNILDVRAQEGSRVQRGQTLAVIDDAQPRAGQQQAEAAVTEAQKEVAAAETELALAQSTLKRYQELFDKKSVSPQEFDEMKTRAQAAEARRDMASAAEAQASAALAQAKTSLGNTQVHAPFAGVVTQKNADAGAFASPGMPLFTLEDTSLYRLEATLDEDDLHLVHAGEAVPVSVDSIGGAEFKGKVAQIVPVADPASRSFLIKITLPADGRLRSGLFGRARFARGTRTAVLVPVSAVVERGQLRGVFVVDAGQVAQLHYVTLGNAAGQSVEVLSGLQAGENLIAVPGDRELGGKKIAPRP